MKTLHIPDPKFLNSKSTNWNSQTVKWCGAAGAFDLTTGIHTNTPVWPASRSYTSLLDHYDDGYQKGADCDEYQNDVKRAIIFWAKIDKFPFPRFWGLRGETDDKACPFCQVSEKLKCREIKVYVKKSWETSRFCLSKFKGAEVKTALVLCRTTFWSQ